MTDQHEKARRWRVARKLTVAELGALTGYSIEAIYAFERGVTPARTWNRKVKGKKRPPTAGKPTADWVWLRYKNACRAVEYHLRTGKEWDWTS